MSTAGGPAAAYMMMAANMNRLKEGIEAAKASWPSMAERGFELDEEPFRAMVENDSAGPTRPKLTGTVGECEVSVRILADSVHYAHTETVARPSEALRGVKVGVHPSPWGIFGAIRSWLGQDIEVGDAEFDDAFLITGDPVSAPRQMLDAPLREKITTLNAGDFTGLVFDGEKATVLMAGVITEPEVLGTVIDVAVAAASWKP